MSQRGASGVPAARLRLAEGVHGDPTEGDPRSSLLLPIPLRPPVVRVVATAAAPVAVTKPAVKKQAPKTKTAMKPPGPAENGRCRLGVIPALGDQFVVQKVGLTVFGNERTEVPIDWSLNDLVVARVRAAAAPGAAVRRLAYAKGAFEPYYHPPAQLFRNARDDLTAIVRQIAANANCERYVVVATFAGTLPGTNQTLSGIGVLNHGTSLFSRTSLFTNFSVTQVPEPTALGVIAGMGIGAVRRRATRRRPA